MLIKIRKIYRYKPYVTERTEHLDEMVEIARNTKTTRAGHRPLQEAE